MISMKFVVFACLSWIFGVAANASLPTVDLGYEVHRAISFNETLQTYNFSNIRFAQPPVGDLRFAKPAPPTGINPDIQDGSQGAICPPSAPVWAGLQFAYAADWPYGNASLLNYQLGQAASAVAVATAPNATFAALDAALLSDPRISEDCLFLDVITPKPLFDRANASRDGAEVVIYIYGGGYIAGDKSTATPDSLLLNAYNKGSEGIVWVALNYRLGALGFLGGPSLQEAGGVSNAAFYDQELAIEWVHNNIHNFGGDPNKITIFGGSAGGGSVLHQITAYGGQKPVKFHKAIALYPGWQPVPSQQYQEENTQGFLKYLDVPTIEDARAASSDAVIRANIRQMALSPSGTFAFGPSVDGVFVPALPSVLLKNGQYAKNITVLASYSENDGVNFTPADVLTDLDFQLYLRRLEPTIQKPVADYIVKKLYPSVYDGSQPYKSPFDRISRFTRDFLFACNSHYLAQAMDTYLYEWAVFPALHGSDFPSLQYSGPRDANSPPAPLWHKELQDYFVDFIVNGTVNGPGSQHWPEGQDASINTFNSSSIYVREDQIARSVCDYFQKGLYD